MHSNGATPPDEPTWSDLITHNQPSKMPSTHTVELGTAARVPILESSVILMLHLHADISFYTTKEKLDFKSSTANVIVRK